MASYSEGKTRISAATYVAGNPDWFTNPRKRTLSTTPSDLASDSMRVEAFRLQRISDMHSGPESSANARNKSRGRFHGCSLAQNSTTAALLGTFHCERTTQRSTLSDCSTHHLLSTQKGANTIRFSGIPKERINATPPLDTTITPRCKSKEAAATAILSPTASMDSF